MHLAQQCAVAIAAIPEGAGRPNSGTHRFIRKLSDALEAEGYEPTYWLDPISNEWTGNLYHLVKAVYRRLPNDAQTCKELGPEIKRAMAPPEPQKRKPGWPGT